MSAVWPDTLPRRFFREGYSRQAGDGRLRTPTTTGPGKTRLRSRAVSDPMTGRMEMTGAQRELFWAFFENDLAKGTQPFVFPDPNGGLPLLVQFGEDLPRESNPSGNLWWVTLPLERLFTGSLQPGLPALPAGAAYLTHEGAYVVLDGRAIVVPAP